MDTENRISPNEAIDDITLALLYLVRRHDGKPPYDYDFSFKTYDWDTLNRLEEKGYFSQSKKTIIFNEDGREKAREILEKYNISDWPTRKNDK